MKIGIVTTWFERGAAYVSRQYQQNLQAAGHEVLIYARGGEHYAKSDPEWSGPEVHWGKVPRWQLNAKPVDRADFLAWIRDNQLDWVLFNEQQWWPPVLWAREAGVKTAAYIDYYRQDSVALFGVYDLLLCNTQRHYSVFRWHPQCYYLPWGTDIELFKPQPQPTSPHRTLFVSAGYSPRRKGVDALLRAFAKLEQPAGQTPARLLIHTQVSLERSLPECLAIIQRLAQQGRLAILTETKSAPGHYHLGDIYVYLSRLDGIGLSLPEALSCGLPAIVPNEAPMNEFVSDGLNGYTVEVARRHPREDNYYWPECHVDENHLQQRLTELCAMSDAALQALKQRSRQQAESQLDWRTQREALSNAFTSSQTLEVTPALRRAASNYFWLRLWRRDKRQLLRRADRYGKQLLQRLSTG